MRPGLTTKYGTTLTPLEERVPVEVITPLIVSWLERHKALHEEPNKNDRSARYVEAESTHNGHLEILGFHSGVNTRSLRHIKRGEWYIGTNRSGTLRLVDWVPFNIADKIVCATVGPLAWHEEPLSNFYGPLPVAGYERKFEREEVAA